MPTDVIMPKLGLTMEMGTVQRWLAEEGQQVKAGDALLEVETDKVVVEVESAATGTLRSVVIRPGETVPIGTVLARIYAPGETPADGELEPGRGAAVAKPAPVAGPYPVVTPLAGHSPVRMGIPPVTVHGSGPGGRIDSQGVRRWGQRERVFSSPRARKRAREAGLDWQIIPGSGPLGRVIERDVLRSLADLPQGTADQGSGIGAPHFYLSAEVRADALLGLCERLLPAVERRAGVRLTVTDLLVKIAAVALAEHPRANAFWDPAEGGRIGLRQQIHVGVAAAADGGLVVRVLHNADRMGLAQIASERSRLFLGAREGSLSPGDLEGGAFTLTDLGMYRVDVFQAILNPPQSVMLAVGRIAERPVAIEGQACVRPTMVVTLSCDARVLNGALGAQFLDRVVELIEEPYGLIA
jgi:pyruvate dehydrogenase E2 component (dihydrolipoamide acetyltransferase)